jgi:hypothetical protein
VAPPSYAILGTPGFVRDPRRFDDETLLKVLGANSGNLMFQYAASQIIDAPQIHVSMAETPYSDRAALREAQALVFPAANHLRLGADWTGLAGYIAGQPLPVVVLGLGAQSPKVGGERETIAALRADAQVMRLVAVLRDKAAFISVRGPYSQTVCEELGLTGVAVMGCPSAMLNPDRAAGAAMAARLATLRDRAGDAGGGAPRAPRLAVTAAAPFEIRTDEAKRDLERRLFSWAMAADGLYVQQSGGVAAMQAADGRWFALDRNARRSITAVMAPEADPVDVWAFMAKAGRFYTSAPAWRDEMRGMDLVLGTRLHGNMAAIAAGTPGVIIAHDSRTGELGQTMHLPHLPFAAAMAAPDLAAALDAVEFDGAAFDAWRQATARRLAEVFARLNIPVSALVRGLAG